MKESEFLINQEYTWDNMLIKDSILKLDGLWNDKPSFISIAAIGNIPYIDFPDFTEEQNKVFQNMAKEVLTVSREENNFNEVSITYRVDLDKEDKNAFRKILGDEKEVKFMSDPVIRDMLSSTKEMLIVNLHNHSNGSKFSVRDLLAFSSNDNIRAMAIISNKGNISLLYRPEMINIRDVVPYYIKKYAPDVFSRITTENKDILKLLTKEENILITKISIKEFCNQGVIYLPNISEENAKNIDFSSNIETFDKV